MQQLDERSFLEVVEATPLVSIDLLLFRSDGAVLLGHRTNRPAKDFWFVPGGRVLKNEYLAEALARIVGRELGAGVPLTEWRGAGVYEHHYPDNFAGADGVSTHYVVLPHRLALEVDVEVVTDDQHDALRWFAIDELLAADDVHPYTKAYFS